MADLFVTDHTPTLGVGRALRSYAIMRALARDGALDVLYLEFGADEPSPEYGDIANLRLHGVRSSRGLRRAAAVAGSRLAGAPAAQSRMASAELVARAAELAPRRGAGRVIADGIGIRVALRALEGDHDMVLNAHNLESDLQRQLGAPPRTVARLARLERRLIDDSVEAWMVSEADLQGARALCPGARLRYVPNVVDTEAIVPKAGAPASDRALLVADYTWPPNAEAARFLVADVMPRVWEVRPSARLVLAGRGLSLPGGTDPRVEVLGYVDDLDAQYAAAACVLVPLLTGGGSPLKFVEGLAQGVPVVATPWAARGLDLTPGVHYLEGAGAAGFAAAVARVLAEGAPGVGAAGRAVAVERYSIEALVDLLRAPLWDDRLSAATARR